jgi:hypothetical protein
LPPLTARHSVLLSFTMRTQSACAVAGSALAGDTPAAMVINRAAMAMSIRLNIMPTQTRDRR